MSAEGSLFQDREVEAKAAQIIDELQLALSWRRPSIILIIYQSEYTRSQVQDYLSRVISKSGQSIIPFKINSKEFDVPVILSQNENREKAIYSISGLRWGGGRGRLKAFRALNLHREHLIESNLRTIFWLTENEAKRLPRHAPDFWAFRHRVFEFPEIPNEIQSSPQLELISLGYWERYIHLEDVAEQISSNEKMLSKLPEEKEAYVTHAELSNKLAALYWVSKKWQKSIDHLDHALILVQQIDHAAAQINILNGLGIVYITIGDYQKSIDCLQETLRREPHNITALCNAAITYQAIGKNSQAIEAIDIALMVGPRSGSAWMIRGKIHHNLGLFEEADKAYRKVTRLLPEYPLGWTHLANLHTLWGDEKTALKSMKKARNLLNSPS